MRLLILESYSCGCTYVCIRLSNYVLYVFKVEVDSKCMQSMVVDQIVMSFASDDHIHEM